MYYQCDKILLGSPRVNDTTRAEELSANHIERALVVCVPRGVCALCARRLTHIADNDGPSTKGCIRDDTVRGATDEMYVRAAATPLLFSD